MARSLHDGLRAGELDVGPEPLGDREVGTAGQQEAEFGCADRLVELGEAAAGDVHLDVVLRVLHDLVDERLLGLIGLEAGGDLRAHAVAFQRLPPLLAERAVEIRQRPSHQVVGLVLAEFGLERLDQGHENLRLDLDLLQDRYVHGLLLFASRR